jgi:hypothetical protein
MLVASFIASACSGNGATDDSSANENTQRFESATKHYSVAYPGSWTVEEDAGSFGRGAPFDVFASPDDGRVADPAVFIGCAPIAAGTTTDDLVASMFDSSEQHGLKPKTAGSVSVVDSTATIITLDDSKVDTTTVMFAHGAAGESNLRSIEGFETAIRMC